VFSGESFCCRWQHLINQLSSSWCITMVPLTAFPFQDATSSMKWPLGPSSSPPLYFESLERLQQIRRDVEFDFVKDIPKTIDTIFPLNGDQNQRHFGLISVALVLLGNGFTDECHNLITPLSWPDDIHFAHGPSIYSKVSAKLIL